MRITAGQPLHETKERTLPEWLLQKAEVLGVEGMLQTGKQVGPQHDKEHVKHCKRRLARETKKSLDKI